FGSTRSLVRVTCAPAAAAASVVTPLSALAWLESFPPLGTTRSPCQQGNRTRDQQGLGSTNLWYREPPHHSTALCRILFQLWTGRPIRMKGRAGWLVRLRAIPRHILMALTMSCGCRQRLLSTGLLQRAMPLPSRPRLADLIPMDDVGRGPGTQ